MTSGLSGLPGDLGDTVEEHEADQRRGGHRHARRVRAGRAGLGVIRGPRSDGRRAEQRGGLVLRLRVIAERLWARRARLAEEDGFALAIAISILFLTSLLVLAAVALATHNTDRANRDRDAVRAGQAADAGVDAALYRLNKTLTASQAEGVLGLPVAAVAETACVAVNLGQCRDRRRDRRLVRCGRRQRTARRRARRRRGMGPGLVLLQGLERDQRRRRSHRQQREPDRAPRSSPPGRWAR